VSGPCEALACEEQARGDNLVARIVELAAGPEPYSLPLWQDAARDAYGTAAANTAQPEGVPR